MKRILMKQLLLVWLMFLGGSALGQIVVTGTVKDGQTDETLPGANVYIEGTTRGVITDMNGAFSIDVPRPNTVLVVSFIGYTQQRIPLAGSTRIQVELFPDITALEEVVVVGYGTVEARKVAGSISSISSDDISQISVTNLDLALQGRAAGLHVSATTGEANTEVRIRIRGNNSISGDNEPLIVVDGFPIFTDPGLGGLGQQNSSALSNINMDDVASIEVLKDAAATAIYGARGANGVLLITTKQGTAGRARIEFTAETNYTEGPTFPEMMSGAEYGYYYNIGDTIFTNPTYDTITNNWPDRIFRPTWGQNYALSVSGGTRDNRYSVSGSYLNRDGALIGSGFTRGTIRANLNNRLTEKITLNSSFSYSESVSLYSENASGGVASTGTIFSAFRSSPLRPIAATWEEEDPFTVEYSAAPNNPVLNIRDRNDRSNPRNLSINITAEYNIFRNFRITLRGGLSNNANDRKMFLGKTIAGWSYNGRGMLIDTKTKNNLIEGFGTYTKGFGDHNLNFVLGSSYQYNTSEIIRNTVDDYFSDGLGIYGMSFGQAIQTYGIERVDRELQSYFFRGNYDYASKYILTFSGRLDGSSVFPANNKYAFFPAAALAWRINEEAFMQNVTLFSELKLRAGYGLTGSQAIRPYQTISQFSNRPYLYGENEVPGVGLSVVGNANLKWETTEQLNVGLDMNVLQGRLGLTVDYYKKTTRDLLLPFQLPPNTSYQNMIINLGTLENQGFEVSLNGEPVKTSRFNWNVNMNVSRNVNLIVDLGELEFIPGPTISGNFFNNPISGQWVDQPFSVYYGYVTEGLIQYHDFDLLGNPLFAPLDNIREVGSIKLKDFDGNGIITALDRDYIGDPNPTFIFGINNDFSFGNFSLNMFWQGSVGNKVFNATRAWLSGSTNPRTNSYKDFFVNRWTEDNQHNNPLYPSTKQLSYLQAIDMYVEDGSYLRLRNLSLRYIVPFNISGIGSLQVYVSGMNILTFTNYFGADPEANLFKNRNDAIGVDHFNYPQTRVYTLGVKLGI